MKRNLVGKILGKIKIFVQDFVPIRTALRDPDLGLLEIIGMMETIFINHSERSSVPKSKESYRKVWGSGSEPRTDYVRESVLNLTCHNKLQEAGA